MEFLHLFLRHHLAGKPGVASPNVNCFLRLPLSLYNNLDSESSPDHLQSSTSPLLLSHCSCSAGCSTKRCSCVRENIKCQDCRCGAPCKNPLNIMAEFGVDVDKATSDICLMQKLPKVCSMSRPPYQTSDTTCLILKFLHR